MKPTLGDAPIEEKYREDMGKVARLVDEIFNGPRNRAKPREIGFILMVFPFEGHEGRCNYMSNAERADVLTLLKEQVARFEQRFGPVSPLPEEIAGLIAELQVMPSQLPGHLIVRTAAALERQAREIGRLKEGA
jgi:hypothetical protein